MYMIDIDREKFYTANEILANDFFPWVKSIRSVINWIEKDMKGENILKTTKYGEDTGTRYLIKGENLINYIVQFEDGSLNLN